MIRRIRAMLAYQVGKRHERARDDIGASRLYARALALSNGRATEVLERLAFVEAELGHYDRAEGAYLEAIEILRGRKNAGTEIACLELGLARVYQKAGRTSDAIPLYQKTILVLEGASDDENTVATALLNLGICLAAEHRHEEAQGPLEKALRAAELATGHKSALTAKVLSQIAFVLKEQYRYAEAEQALRRAADIIEAIHGESESQAWVFGEMASLFLRERRYQDARDYYRRTLDILERLRGLEHPELAPVLNNLAIAEGRCDNDAKAAAYYQRVLAIDEQAFGGRHPEVASVLNNLAALYLKEGRLADAESAATRSVAIIEETLGPAGSQLATSLFNLAAVLNERGSLDRAHALLERALTIHDRTKQGGDPNTARILGLLGHVEMARGNLDVAKGHFRHAREIIDANPVAGEARLVSVLSGQAALEEALGHVSVADALHQQACQLGSEVFGAESLGLARVLTNYASFLRRTGQSARAEETETRINAIRAAHAWAHPSYSID